MRHLDHDSITRHPARKSLPSPVPVPAASQLPAVDDVAHQVKRVGISGTQEFEQTHRLAACRAQVDVGIPDGPEAQAPGTRRAA